MIGPDRNTINYAHIDEHRSWSRDSLDDSDTIMMKSTGKIRH